MYKTRGNKGLFDDDYLKFYELIWYELELNKF